MNVSNQETPEAQMGADRARPSRILIDCTETFASGLTTGIQRVVQKIAGRAEQLSREIGIPCIVIVTDGVKVRRIPFPVLAPSHNRVGRTRGRIIIDKGRAIWDRWVEPLFGRLDLRAAARRSAWILFIMMPMRLRKGTGHLEMEVQKGDLLLLPDSFWGLGYSVRLAEKAHVIGACVVPIIHDIFPITHPEFADTKNATAFKAAFARLVSVSHGLLTVSLFTQGEVQTLLTQQGACVPPIRSFRLGADAFAGASQAIPVRTEIQQLRDLYLMVGTIEPRKGHATVLDAFDQLWRNGGDATLVLVGRVGWRCEEFQRRLDAHPLLKRRLFVFYDATDSDLDYLYKQARALVIASRVEGFGLPLVEAMRYGVPVIASRIDVFREVGEDYPDYFSVDDAADLLGILEQYERQGGVTRPPRDWPTWDESALSAMWAAVSLYEDSFARYAAKTVVRKAQML